MSNDMKALSKGFVIGLTISLLALGCNVAKTRLSLADEGLVEKVQRKNFKKPPKKNTKVCVEIRQDSKYQFRPLAPNFLLIGQNGLAKWGFVLDKPYFAAPGIETVDLAVGLICDGQLKGVKLNGVYVRTVKIMIADGPPHVMPGYHEVFKHKFKDKDLV